MEDAEDNKTSQNEERNTENKEDADQDQSVEKEPANEPEILKNNEESNEEKKDLDQDTEKSPEENKNDEPDQDRGPESKKEDPTKEDSVIDVDIIEKNGVESVKEEAEPGKGVKDELPKSAIRVKKSSTSSKSKKPKKPIFISYSPDAGFYERRFVVETVKQLKENNLAEDIWFDKDERITDSPCWFSMRMEAVEKCRAAILILSNSYFSCPVSVYEARALLERQKADSDSVRVFKVLFSPVDESEVPNYLPPILEDNSIVNLTVCDNSKRSLTEKISVVIGSLMVDIEKYATQNTPPTPLAPPDSEPTGEYKNLKICQWRANDLQEWLYNLGIKEFYRESLAESMVDGFLLMSLTDQDMIRDLSIDSRVVRKKIMQSILVTLDKEHKLPENWHLRARTMRAKPNTVYIIYDPADVRLAQKIKQDLIKKGISVIHHGSLGQSKEEFLQLNGNNMAQGTHVLVVLTDAAIQSPFLFQEVLFCDWLGKKIITAVFKNVWTSLRPALKGVLGECMSIDFETKMYHESLDILQHHIKPPRTVPGVILEQSFLNKMTEGIRPLSSFAPDNNGPMEYANEENDAKVFISYQWDVQSKVEDIRRALEIRGLICWADINMAQHPATPMHCVSASGRRSSTDQSNETLQSQIHRTMRNSSVVICCITPKYLQSDNCIKDLTLAETFRKPLFPVMLRFSPWPPEGAPSQVRKILSRSMPIDLSNEKLYKQNLPILVERVKKIASGARMG